MRRARDVKQRHYGRDAAARAVHKGLLPSPAQQEALRAQAQAAQKMMSSPEQMEAYRCQAEWARRIAVSVNQATLCALREAHSSQEVLGAVEAARKALGEQGFAAAQVLTDRELFFRPLRRGERGAIVRRGDRRGVRPGRALVENGLREHGTPIPDNDVWMSALALQHGLAVLSRDEHFGRVAELEFGLTAEAW